MIEETTDTVTPDAVNVSPGKRVNLRGQCVQQLLQLHELLEKGGINKQQYDEMQSTIMGDVKKYWDRHVYNRDLQLHVHNYNYYDY